MIQSLLKEMNAPWAYADCIEDHTPRLLYERFLSQLRNLSPLRKEYHKYDSVCLVNTDSGLQPEVLPVGRFREGIGKVVLEEGDNLFGHRSR